MSLVYRLDEHFEGTFLVASFFLKALVSLVWFIGG